MSYGPIDVVHNLCLTVAASEIVTILGRNGAGKTTTLNGIAGVVKPKSGKISLDGRARQAEGERHRPPRGRLRARRPRVFPGLTVWENLASAAYGHGLRRRAAARDHRAASYFPALEPRMKQRAGTMSGGEQQMLALARALVSRPRLFSSTSPVSASRRSWSRGCTSTSCGSTRRDSASFSWSSTWTWQSTPRRVPTSSRRGVSRTKAHARTSREQRTGQRLHRLTPTMGGTLRRRPARRTARRGVAIGSVLLSFTLLAAACGDDSDSEATRRTAAAAATTAAGAATTGAAAPATTSSIDPTTLENGQGVTDDTITIGVTMDQSGRSRSCRPASKQDSTPRSRTSTARAACSAGRSS